eukprot:1394466-Rhodomonas_salina.2
MILVLSGAPGRSKQSCRSRANSRRPRYPPTETVTETEAETAIDSDSDSDRDRDLSSTAVAMPCPVLVYGHRGRPIVLGPRYALSGTEGGFASVYGSSTPIYGCDPCLYGAPVYAGNDASCGCDAATYAGAPIYGCYSPVYGCDAAVFGASAFIFGGDADMDGGQQNKIMHIQAHDIEVRPPSLASFSPSPDTASA